jgi:hypothetical protein
VPQVMPMEVLDLRALQRFLEPMARAKSASPARLLMTGADSPAF